jgi:site-specific recombinase XerD
MGMGSTAVRITNRSAYPGAGGNADDSTAPSMETHSSSVITVYREALASRHYARRTIGAYERWLRRFLRFHQMRHPRQMGSQEINAFRTHLAVNEQVSASTQNQALASLLFLYKRVLEIDPGDLDGAVRARRPKRLPVVLSVIEVRAVLQQLEGPAALVCGLLYGGGLRLMEGSPTPARAGS